MHLFSDKDPSDGFMCVSLKMHATGEETMVNNYFVSL